MLGKGLRAARDRAPRTPLPLWVLYEWSAAQYELDNLRPSPSGDVYSVSPYDFEWVYFDRPFWIFYPNGSREEVYGATILRKRQIMICCGRSETVRHEAWHAILGALGDDRSTRHRADGPTGRFRDEQEKGDPQRHGRWRP